ncbi:MAG TPA: hypothetical protein VNT32_02260 [Thermoleophilaceae bacterium]|nr:hypothetical protein [Thermoleophilaceae bacterium]
MRRLAPLAAVAVLALLPPAGESVVSPNNCGKISAKGKRYQVKSHLISCRIAKPAADRFLETGRRPSGYTCRTFSPEQTKIRFRCFRGQKDFYAIRL